jgi:hypothetical protein
MSAELFQTINDNTIIDNTINTTESLIDCYNKIAESHINLLNKKEKIQGELHIPKFEDSEWLLRYNYNVTQLKTIAKTYKLKVSGNKSQLIGKIYSFLFLSNIAVKVQRVFRGHLVRHCMRCRGPALNNRALCTNTYDFFSMEPMSEIKDTQFFSYKDADGFIYGFDILSLHNLISNSSSGETKNPFNMKSIHPMIIGDFKTLLNISKVIELDICLEIDDNTKELSNKKQVELQALSLFQNIDALGNYSNPEWFLNLNRNQMVKFLRELIDIWCYRAPLTMETKRAICPPLGNPFHRMPTYNVLHTLENIDDVRKHILHIMEKMVNTGVDKDSKCLGAYYVLGALTLVSNDAATSLPWLYQALCYM